MESRSGIDLPQELDDYIKETIDYSLGLPVSSKTLELKLQASEEARRNLQNQYFVIHSKLKQKDIAIERARAESSVNAQALKKFVEENQRLAEECSKLLNEISRLENECSLYEHDRDALMEFANEAEERAKEAEVRVLETNDRLKKMMEELEFYKNQSQTMKGNEIKLTDELQLLNERISAIENLRLQGCSDNNLDSSQCSSPRSEDLKQFPRILTTTPEDLSPIGSSTLEEQLLHSVLDSIFENNGGVANARAFLEDHCDVESCHRLLIMWDRLRPSSQNVIALAAEVQTLKNDKEHLISNLTRAEEEVKVLFEENTTIEEEKKRLLKLYNREKHHHGSGGKHSCSSSAKSHKRKSNPRECSSVEAMMDLDSGSDMSRPPLSPLHYNSPDSRMHKK
ncbi:hypothetical protein ACHQM5_005252 [Ranunculus cassubicifolius]